VLAKLQEALQKKNAQSADPTPGCLFQEFVTQLSLLPVLESCDDWQTIALTKDPIASCDDWLCCIFL